MKGVTYIDTRTGEEYEQPAGLVVLGAYVFNNVLLMLHRRHRRALRSEDRARASSARTTATRSAASRDGVLRGQGDQPVHGGGRRTAPTSTISTATISTTAGSAFSAAPDRRRHHQRPADRTRPVPPGTPRWGRQWKEATAKWYNHAFNISASGCNYRHRENYPRPRSDLQGRARPAAHPHELQFHATTTTRWRSSSAACSTEIAAAMKPTINGQRQRAPRQLQHRAVSIDPQHRRHDHGHRSARRASSTSICQSWDARQSVRHGRVAVPAERLATIRPARSARWPTGRRTRSPSATSRTPARWCRRDACRGRSVCRSVH